MSAKMSECKQNVFLCIMLIKQSYRIGWKSDISLFLFSPGSAETNIGHLMASYTRMVYLPANSQLSMY